MFQSTVLLFLPMAIHGFMISNLGGLFGNQGMPMSPIPAQNARFALNSLKPWASKVFIYQVQPTTAAPVTQSPLGKASILTLFTLKNA